MSVCRICGHKKEYHKKGKDGMPWCEMCLQIVSLSPSKACHEFVPYRKSKTDSNWAWTRRNLNSLYGKGWRRGRFRI